MPTSSDKKMFALVDYFGADVARDFIKEKFVENGCDYWKAREAIDELLGRKFIDLPVPYIVRNREFEEQKLKFEGEVQQLHQEMFACEDEQRQIELARRINQMVIDWNYEVQYSEHYYDLHYMVLSGAVSFAEEIIEWTWENHHPGQVVMFETGFGKPMNDVLYRALSQLEGVEVGYLLSNAGVIVVIVN